MPLKIKPEPARDTTKLSVRFPAEIADQIEMYSQLLQSSVNYVVVEAVRAFISADKGFMEAWAARQARAAKGTAPSSASGQPQGVDAAARKGASPSA